MRAICFVMSMAAAAAVSIGASAVRAECSGDDARLFEEGSRLKEGGDVNGGCALLLESFTCNQKKDGRLYSIAECADQQKRPGAAVWLYTKYLARFAEMSPDLKKQHEERAAYAERRAAALKPSVTSFVTIHLPPGAAGESRVRCDAIELSPAEVGSPVPLDPGEHVVTVEASGSVKKIVLHLAEGEQKRVQFSSDAPPLPPPLPPKPPPDRAMSRWRVGALVTGAAGLVEITVGAIAGLIALSRADEVKQKCPNRGCVNEESLHFVKETQTLGLVSTVGLSVGAVSVASGATIWLLSPPLGDDGSRKPRISLSPGVSRSGAFLVLRGEL